MLAVGFSIFSYRRWQDTRAFSLYAEELSMIAPMTNLPNRRAVQRILNQINAKKEYPVGVLLVDIEGLEVIRSKLGQTVLEHVMIEILYHISKHLTGEQLVAYWQAGQFVCLCPGFDNKETHLLKQKTFIYKIIGLEMATSLQRLPSSTDEAQAVCIFGRQHHTPPICTCIYIYIYIYR